MGIESGASGNVTIPDGVISIAGDNFASEGQYPVTVTPTDENDWGQPIEGLVEVFDNPIAEAVFAETQKGKVSFQQASKMGQLLSTSGLGMGQHQAQVPTRRALNSSMSVVGMRWG